MKANKGISYPGDKSVQDEIFQFIKLPFEFKGFIDFPNLIDNEVNLKCVKKVPGDITRNWVPAYHFAICINDKQIGIIDIRIGYNEGLYYGGNIGYSIDEAYRGRGYAGRACKLIAKVAKAHKMKMLIISNEYSNNASKRVCEKIGARFVRVVKLPEDNDMRKDGHEFENIYLWNLEAINSNLFTGIFSIISLFFYFLPWIMYNNNRINLGLHMMGVIWFAVAWIFVILHIFLIIKKKINIKSHIFSASIILFGYVMIIIAILNGYLVTI